MWRSPELRRTVLTRHLAAMVAAVAITGVAQGTVRRVPTEYPTIQNAIDSSASGDTVLLSPGTYRGVGNRDIELRGRNVVVTSEQGPEATIIDCESAGRGFYVHQGETRAARIEGITIQNGRADYGGGIRCSSASPTISACRIIDNQARMGGGLDLVVFSGVVDRCVISGNLGSQSEGGGLLFTFGQPEITNCVITGNWSYWGGGVVFPGAGTNRLVNCTITANLGSHGGGIYAANEVLLERCIVWGNCVVLDAEEMLLTGGGTVICSDVDTTGVFSMQPVIYEDCINADPMFCAPDPCGWGAGGDWTLHADSPCLPEHSPCGEPIGALGLGCGLPTSTGACCFPGGACVLLTAPACQGQQGVYVGDNVPCQPNPCGAVPVEVTSWGRIKSMFRGQ